MQTKIKRQCPVIQQSRTASGTASNYINDETRREEDTKLTLKKEPGYFTSSSLRYTIYGRKKQSIRAILTSILPSAVIHQ